VAYSGVSRHGPGLGHDEKLAETPEAGSDTPNVAALRTSSDLDRPRCSLSQVPESWSDQDGTLVVPTGFEPVFMSATRFRQR
jgi:hypothetical protein